MTLRPPKTSAYKIIVAGGRYAVFYCRKLDGTKEYGVVLNIETLLETFTHKADAEHYIRILERKP